MPHAVPFPATRCLSVGLSGESQSPVASRTPALRPATCTLIVAPHSPCLHAPPQPTRAYECAVQRRRSCPPLCAMRRRRSWVPVARAAGTWVLSSQPYHCGSGSPLRSQSRRAETIGYDDCTILNRHSSSRPTTVADRPYCYWLGAFQSHTVCRTDHSFSLQNTVGRGFDFCGSDQLAARLRAAPPLALSTLHGNPGTLTACKSAGIQ